MIDYIRHMRKYIGHERLQIVGAGVFIYKDGKLLLQKRKDNGKWSDHGGCVELAETVEAAAKRELFEETGLIANSLELIGIFSGKEFFYTYPNGDKVAIIGIAFLCEDFSGEIICQKDEVLELQWFSIDNLPEISPVAKPALEKCLEVLRAKSKRMAGL